MATLERAISIAAEAHAGQIDKAGKAYILHPLRVMLSLSTDQERIVGVLHDVVEDCKAWTFSRLADEGFSDEIILALKSVTKHEPNKNPVILVGSTESDEEPYEDFIRRAAANKIGAKVKRADLLDNMDLSRIAEPTDNDLARMIRYKNALKILVAETGMDCQ